MQHTLKINLSYLIYNLNAEMLDTDYYIPYTEEDAKIVDNFSEVFNRAVFLKKKNEKRHALEQTFIQMKEMLKENDSRGAFELLERFSKLGEEND